MPLPQNHDDVIDSRDVIEAMEAMLEIINDDDATQDDCDEAQTEYDKLKALADGASDYAADWEYGETLIRDSYFQEYAQDLAEDIGAVNSDATWPNNCIDWKQAARELQMDYTAVDFDGVTYWIR